MTTSSAARPQTAAVVFQGAWEPYYRTSRLQVGSFLHAVQRSQRKAMTIAKYIVKFLPPLQTGPLMLISSMKGISPHKT